MNKTDKLENTLINPSAPFQFVETSFWVGEKRCATVPFLLDHETIAHLAISGFLKFHESQGGLFSDNSMFLFLEATWSLGEGFMLSQKTDF